jgi:branched-chain amino acid transport system substrate-binding protein
MKRTTKVLFLLVVVFTIHFIPGVGRGADYNISQSVDYTGPFAAIMKSMDDSRRVFMEWWNETKGSTLGIKLYGKPYETRYDSSIVASLWPKILASDKPIAHLAVGSSDMYPLMARLPSDKVPMFHGTATPRMLWQPNQWIFPFHPTYIHETAAFLGWARKNLIKDRPIRFGSFEFKSPAVVEIQEGHIKLAKERDWLEFLGAEWVDMKPVTVVSEMRRMAKKNPDFIRICGNTAIAIAVIKAQRELGIHVPIVTAAHCGIQMSAKASGDMNLLEGHYDAYAGDPAIDMNIPGAKIFEEWRKKMGIKTTWDNGVCNNGIAMLLTCRAIERAAAKVGSNNITGEALYNAMFEGPFTKESMLGLTSNLEWTKEVPFPQKGLKISITTVKNGKQVLISDDVPVPEIPKW